MAIGGRTSLTSGAGISYRGDRSPFGGHAARVYRRMRVAEASNWEVVKATLMAEYGLPRQEAFRRWRDRLMKPDEPVDIYADDLQRWGSRFGMS